MNINTRLVLFSKKEPDPVQIKKHVIKMDQSKRSLPDREIDKLLGLDCKTDEKKVDKWELKDKYGIEQYLYEGTPYDYIRRFLRVLNPQTTDRVYDLGSGYGRIVLYGAITSPANFTGIEIVPERVEKAEARARFLALNNSRFVQGNVLAADFSDGDIFFLFNPFFLETLEKVGEQLKAAAKKRPVRIVSWGGTSDEYFSAQPWLIQTTYAADPYDRFCRLKFYESVELKREC